MALILGNSHQKKGQIFGDPTPNDTHFSTTSYTKWNAPCFRSPIGTCPALSYFSVPLWDFTAYFADFGAGKCIFEVKESVYRSFLKVEPSVRVKKIASMSNLGARALLLFCNRSASQKHTLKIWTFQLLSIWPWYSFITQTTSLINNVIL